MGGRRLQFIISVPRGVRVSEIEKINELPVHVLEDHKLIDKLPYAQAKIKYAGFHPKNGR